jgi:signal transduction histidine kinase
MTAEQNRIWKHELRTPLNHIMGYSELLQEGAAEEGEVVVGKRAKMVHEDAQILASLIDHHIATAPDPRGASEALRDAASPLIAAIMRNAEPQSSDYPLWSRDFGKIKAAAEKLSALLSSLDESSSIAIRIS